VESGILATPFVRGLIKSQGLDINKIQGSGADGRILEKDVENMINQKQPDQGKETPSVKTPEVRSAVTEVTTMTMSAFEKGMQKSMTESNTIPHLYLHE
jgi:pyruvate/2-oxoglutarate dehydrogenase complex dihydrolipoamide acyltransferase (E2) component